MSIYTYSDETDLNLPALVQALPFNGVFDAVVTLDGTFLCVDTAIGTQVQVDAAVADAQEGTLFSNKTHKIEAVSAKSEQLMAEGVDDWSSNKVELSKALADGYYTDYEYYTANPTQISSQKPYIVFRVDGRASSTTSTADIKILADNSADRLIEIYVLNDGSNPKGELPLVQDILAAADQTALDAITDTRV